ncbi:MAG: type II toxin-antitoxin system VapC family toxin [Rhodospirillaceae bacterium]|nr:type II toxin-antitoxin system VapC family toxin [Rhodospirillaceae bacterium]
MKTVDTSIVVAAFATWHADHQSARRAIDDGPRLVEHCAIESYSVLTRLPPPHRVAGTIVAAYLADRFPETFLRLTPDSAKRMILSFPERGIAGGAVYDALIAATARAFDAELLTMDRRAMPVYERIGVRARLLP